MRSHFGRAILAILTSACAHAKTTEVAAGKSPSPPIHIIERGGVPPAGTRIAYVFNGEPPVVVVSDGKGGPEVLYHGHPLNPDRLKSIRVMKATEARAKFSDPTISAAIVIELK